jgi:hypothetical protein
MYIFLAVIILIIFLILLPLRFSVQGLLSSTTKSGELSVKFLGLRLYKIKATLQHSEDGYILCTDKKGDYNLSVKGLSPRRIIRSARSLKPDYLKNLRVKRIEINVNFGSGDAMQTALILGSIRIIFYSVAAAMSNGKRIKIYEAFTPSYQKKILTAELNGIFSISIADIIYGFLSGLIKKIRKRTAKKIAKG